MESAAINLGYTKVRAPISGRIGRSAITPGALVTAEQTTALATIQSLNPIYVDVSQSADALLEAAPGALRRPARPGALEHPGQARAVRRHALRRGRRAEVLRGHGRPEHGLGDAARRLPEPARRAAARDVRARHPERGRLRRTASWRPAGRLRTIPRARPTPSWSAPTARSQPRTLTTAEAIGDKWLVTDGLKPGDKLIVEGLLKVQPGMAVRAVPAGSSNAPPAGGGPARSGAPSASGG